MAGFRAASHPSAGQARSPQGSSSVSENCVDTYGDRRQACPNYRGMQLRALALHYRTFTVNAPTLAKTITVPTITIIEGRCANITHAITIATGGMR